MVRRRYKEASTDMMRDQFEEFMSVKPCSACHGSRLRPEALAIKVGGLDIRELTELTVSRMITFFDDLKLTEKQALIGKQVLKEIRARLSFLATVGLDYLTLARTAGTLSGGEAQRIRLATQIGAGLVGVLYILDEPSIGLHQRDNDRLLSALKHLRDAGNTLIVVEHDEDTMHAADCIVDIGPAAGEHGGRVVARIPVGTLTVVTGVSGSGKSTLVNEILYKGMAEAVYGTPHRPGEFKAIKGTEYIDKIINIDQAPIGRTPRSNPATYTGVSASMLKAVVAKLVAVTVSFALK